MKKRLFLHSFLFALTLLSTFISGGAANGDYKGGAIYGVAIMAILLSHEMGHYVMSRKYGVHATLPYFIPFPLSPFGTLGAVIRMSGGIRDKKALFDIGISGPLVGFILSVPCVIVGLMFSKPVKIPISADIPIFGDSLFIKVATWWILGKIPSGYDVAIHPLGFAGWVGLFITAFNLLPIGQLDGGHIMYAVLGHRGRYVARALIPVLILLSIFCSIGWVTLAILLLIFGVGHPDPYDTWTPLDRKRKVLAIAMLVVFMVSFIPDPFKGTSIIKLLMQSGWLK
jgi:membrane-associated protease RseP (regulator of RpoE activity)